MKHWVLNNGYKIYKLLNGRSNVYLLKTQNGNILVDTGVQRNRKKLLTGIQKVAQNKIHMLWLTHTHFDHVANAAFLKEKYDSKIVVGSAEAPNCRNGFTPLPKGTNSWGRFVSKLGNSIGEERFGFKPFNPNVSIDGKTSMKKEGFDVTIIPTPGHSEGSVCFIVNNEIAFVGDSLFGVFPDTIFPPFADDIIKLLESWKDLIDANCRIYLPGHGKEIRRELIIKEHNKCLKKFG